MAEMDRSKRYANSPKAKKKGGAPDKDETGAEKKVEASAAAGKDVPHAKDPDKAGKVGEDKGPEAGRGSTMGVMAERHKSEHTAMHKRHGEAMTAMHESHAKEAKEMHARHSKEMQDHMESGAEHAAEASAGSPKELGKEKSEGKKGSEV